MLSIVIVEKILRKLQHSARQSRVPGSLSRMTWRLPDDLSTDENSHISLHDGEFDLVSELVAELVHDLRFEYLKESDSKAAALRFAAEATFQRSIDHVPAFIARYSRRIQTHPVVFAILHLEVPQRLKFGEVVLLPLQDELVPEVPELVSTPHCGGYLMTSSRGTHSGLTADRARQVALQAVGLLRVGMQMEFKFHRDQWRFRLGETYVIAEEHVGWQRHDHTVVPVRPNHETFDRISRRAVSQVLNLPQENGLKKQAMLALEWINRSLLTSEPLVAMLYQFFALEAILGDTAEGLKSHRLAFRRTMLGHVVAGSWSAPELIYAQYRDIRSAAVHGGEIPDISPKAARSFESDVIQAVEQYLTFATANNLTRNAQVRIALDTHPDVHAVLEHMRARDPEWDDFTPSAK